MAKLFFFLIGFSSGFACGGALCLYYWKKTSKLDDENDGDG